jgi:hypothetical protein
MSMSKGFALMLVLVFLTASYIIVVKPALSSDVVTENSWTAKSTAAHRIIEGEIT